MVTGRYDIIAEVVTTDGMNGLYEFLNISLQKLGGIQSSEMFVVMKASHKWMLLPPAMTQAWTGQRRRLKRGVARPATAALAAAIAGASWFFTNR